MNSPQSISEQELLHIENTCDPTTLPEQQLREYLYWKGFYDEHFFYQFFLRDWMMSDTGEIITSPPFHAELRAKMDSGSTVAIIPRGFGKTTNGKMRYLRLICYGKLQHVLFWMSKQLIETVLGDIRLVFEQNKEIKFVFGNLVPNGTKEHKGKRWTSQQLQFTNGAKITGITQWSAVRGGRYDEIWADDVQEDSDVANPEMAERFRHHFAASLMPSLKPGGRIHVTGTNVGQACLVKQLFDEDGNGFQKLWYKAVEEPVFTESGALVGGTPLWPARFPIAALEDYRRRMGTRVFNQEFQNESYVKNGASVFAPDPKNVWVREPVFTQNDIQFYQSHVVTDAVWGIDLASGKESGDWSTIVGIDGQGELLCQWRGKVPQYEVVEVMQQIWDMGYRGQIVPERNMGLAFLDACRGKNFYPHALYRQRIGSDKFGKSRSKDYGIYTTATSKRQMVERLRMLLHGKGLSVSQEIADEIAHYRFDAKGGMNATLGHHDDLLMAFMIAYYVQWFEARMTDIEIARSFL